MIESLVNPRNAEGHPFEMFFLGVVYTSVAIFLSLWIFRDYSSLVMVFLTVVASIPLVYTVIGIEEKTKGGNNLLFGKERDRRPALCPQNIQRI